MPRGAAAAAPSAAPAAAAPPPADALRALAGLDEVTRDLADRLAERLTQHVFAVHREAELPDILRATSGEHGDGDNGDGDADADEPLEERLSRAAAHARAQAAGALERLDRRLNGDEEAAMRARRARRGSRSAATPPSARTRAPRPLDRRGRGGAPAPADDAAAAAARRLFARRAAAVAAAAAARRRRRVRRRPRRRAVPSAPAAARPSAALRVSR